MSAIIRLQNNGYSTELVPGNGGAVLTLRKDGLDILRPSSLAAVAADPRNAAYFSCVPYFGRHYESLCFDDREWTLLPTHPGADPNHALHGEGWVSPWQVKSHTNNSATLVFNHAGEDQRDHQLGTFPFSYSVEQTIALKENGATISLTLWNKGPSPMPAGLGLHPFFQKNATTTMTFTADQFWSPPDTKQPLPDKLGRGEPGKLPITTLDSSYLGFTGRVIIANGDREMTVTSDAPVLHIYSPQNENFVCIEPVSHAPGAFVSKDRPYPGAILAPDNSLSLTFTISA